MDEPSGSVIECFRAGRSGAPQLFLHRVCSRLTVSLAKLVDIASAESLTTAVTEMVGSDATGIREERAADFSRSELFGPPESWDSFSRVLAWEATSALTRREGAEVLLAKDGRAVLVDIAVEAGAEEEAPTGMAEVDADEGIAFVPMSCWEARS